MSLVNGTNIIDALTPIAGPSHEELRRPFQDYGKEPVERAHSIHSRATGRASQSGKAEASGVPSTTTISSGSSRQGIGDAVSAIRKELASGIPEETL
jgi:hypothetical protein